jgi:ribosomal protein S18 acetylase RimI-like enzyme
MQDMVGKGENRDTTSPQAGTFPTLRHLFSFSLPDERRQMAKSARSRRASGTIAIRPMNLSDVPELLCLMRALVHFERGQNFNLTESELLRRGFGKQPEFGAYVADAGSGSLVGMAVYYEIPFMHTLQPLLMMKWLYVDPEYRGERIGQRLMRQMALHAHSTGHERFYWFVLNDNVPAQSFYRRLGAAEDAEWRRWVMPTDALSRLAESAE